MMEPGKKPILIVFAGPNGSGKSTITQSYDIPHLYLNADEIQKHQNPITGESLNDANLRAANEAQRQRELAIANSESFAMETVLSTPRNLNFMQQAQKAGYEVALIYVITQDSDINVQRIVSRKAKGGHDVPTEKIISRYEKCLNLLPKVFEVADKARIYNNSLEHPILLVEKKLDKTILLYPQKLPSIWNEQRIKELIGIEVSRTNSPEIKTLLKKPPSNDFELGL